MKKINIKKMSKDPYPLPKEPLKIPKWILKWLLMRKRILKCYWKQKFSKKWLIKLISWRCYAVRIFSKITGLPKPWSIFSITVMFKVFMRLRRRININLDFLIIIKKNIRLCWMKSKSYFHRQENILLLITTVIFAYQPTHLNMTSNLRMHSQL